jgi:hypothetical protein
MQGFIYGFLAIVQWHAMPRDPDELGQPPRSPFKTDAQMWETAFNELYRLAKPRLRKRFRLRWKIKYELPYGRPPGTQN